MWGVEYVERLLRDTEQLVTSGTMKADGSSDLGVLLTLRGVREGWRRPKIAS